MGDSLRRKTFKGTIWSSLERFSVQGVQFVVMILMARILTPDDYGLIAMLTVFIAISQSLVDSGFSNALIRKQNRDETDNSTVFYFNILIGLILYLVLFFLSPVISRFYEQPLLTPLTRLISLSVIINSLVVVQRAILTSSLDFKTLAKASMTAAIVSGFIGVIMAYTDYGVWSIVGLQLSNLLVNAVLLWFFSKWRPRLLYSWKSFLELFGFGSKLAASGIIDTIYNNVYLLVIGKIFNASDLGFYTRAQQFASYPSQNITGIIQRVTYPVLCTMQDDIDRLRSVYRRLLRLTAFIIFPLMVGLAAVAKPLVLLLLGNQWAFTIVLLQIICFVMIWYPIHAINLNLLQVMGRSDLFLKLEIIKKIIGITILCITVPMGLIAMCVGSVISSIACLAVNTHYTGKLIQVGFIVQIRDLLPTIFYSLSMCVIVFLIVSVIPNLWGQLIFGIISGIIFFIVITYLTRSRDLNNVISCIKDLCV